MKGFFLILFVLPLTLFSCAKEKKPAVNSPIQSPVYKVPAPDLKSATKIANNVKPSCGSNGDCSLSVGLLSFADDEGAGQCTASLIGPDIILTNTHCVPDDLKESNSSCKGRMWMNFIPTNGYDSTIDCDRILFTSKKSGTIDADYAYIKLAKASNRPYLDTSREGFSNGELVDLYKMDPIQADQGLQGELKKVKCRTVMDSLLPRKFDIQVPTSPYVTFADCRVIPGNSGGPVVGVNGKVKGVIFALLHVQKYVNSFTQYGITSSSKTHRYMSLATNLRCMKDVNLQDGDPSECSEESIAESIKNYRSRYQQNQIGANTEIQRLVSEKPLLAAFRWAFSTKAFVKKTKTGEKEYKYLSFLEPYCYLLAKKSVITNLSLVERPIFETDVSYDERFLPKFRFTKVYSTALNESLDVHEDGSDIKIKFQPNDINSLGLNSGFEASLSPCI